MQTIIFKKVDRFLEFIKIKTKIPRNSNILQNKLFVTYRFDELFVRGVVYLQ